MPLAAVVPSMRHKPEERQLERLPQHMLTGAVESQGMSALGLPLG